MQLNPDQEDVANHVTGRILALAGPGSGKTRTLTERTGRLIRGGADPGSILCLTFTNKARDEMKARIAATHGEAAKPVFISNFHGLCGILLRKFGGTLGYPARMTVIDADDQVDLILQIARKRGIEATKPQARLLAMIANDWRENLGDDAALDELAGERLEDKELGIVREYVRLLRSRGQTDFSGLLSETAHLIKTEGPVQDRLQRKFRFIQVDEYQDTNRAQNAIVELIAGPDDNVLAVGDMDQCQPAGTMVLTTRGLVDIADLDPASHRLVSFSRRQSVVLGWKYGLWFKKSARPYEGPMLHVRVDGQPQPTRCTPNHRWTVKIGRSEIGHWHSVYLMRKGRGWRVGRTQLYRSHRTSGGSFGPPLRARQEKADAVWVLRLFASTAEAQMYEQQVSCLYGIPTLCFNPPPGSEGYAETLQRLHDRPPGLDRSAQACLADHGRDVEYPLWEKLVEGINPDFGKRLPTLVAACNLLPEVMRVPVPTGGKEFEWRRFTASAEPFRGTVYSLDVDRHHHYIADGVITHNSIYEWRGASPDSIPRFIAAGRAKTGACKVVKLGVNYRSTPQIVEMADRLIRHSADRTEIAFSAIRPPGEVPKCVGFDAPEQEADAVAMNVQKEIREGTPPGEIAVFYRANDMSRQVEQALTRRQIPYTVVGGGSYYDRMEVKDVLSLLRFACNPKDGIAFARVANKPARGMGDTLIGRLEAWAEQSDVDLLTALRRCEGIHDEHGKLLGEAAQKACRAVLDVFDVRTTGRSVWQIADELLSRSKYDQFLKEKYSGGDGEMSATKEKHGGGGKARGRDKANPKEYEDRQRNVGELLNSIALFCRDHPGADVADYLQSISLYTGGEKDRDEPAVRLMSLHASKGLEFDVVYLIGCEQGVLPHHKAVSDRGDKGLEEERRLCYVGFTRAKKLLRVTWCRQRQDAASRGAGGKFKGSRPSRFLLEAGLMTPAEFQLALDETRAGFAGAAARAKAGRAGPQAS